MTTTTTPEMTPLAQHIDKAASQCVKCGLCLPYCPTYVLAEDENESPRGRIALMQGAVRQQVPITEKLTYHIDTCLGCRGCERVCPASVQYADLLTSTRTWLVKTKARHPSLLERSLIYIMERPRLRNIFRFFKNFSVGTKRVVPISNRAQSSEKNKILILPPCASTLFDTRTIADAQELLTHLGFRVELATPAGCCGALALHAGELENAKQCAQQQVALWKTVKPDYILTLASGCHSTLQDYAKPPLNISVPDIPLQTIESFLLDVLHKKSFALPALMQKMVVHIPCTLRNAVRTPNVGMQLLQNIPELNCIPLPNAVQCCGAAGTNFLRHPDIASALAAPMVEFIKEQNPDAWVTSNIGCAMYVQQELKKQGVDIPVLHPVSVVLRAIEILIKGRQDMP